MSGKTGYKERIILAMTSRPDLYPDGAVRRNRVYHDHWCAINSDIYAECTCFPDILVITPKGEYFIDLKGRPRKNT